MLNSDSPARNIAPDEREATQPVAPSPRLRWRRSNGSVALALAERVVWQFNYGTELNTPFFHPVATWDGRVMTWDRPPDHDWHHGMWFSWKFINGVNYWEHDGRTGKPAGRTAWSKARVETRDDHSAVISMELDYHPANRDEVVLRERRRIDVSSPDAKGVYRMDWTCIFTAGGREVRLDRTPPKEQAWGGYAGLSVRFAKNFTERQAIDGERRVEFGAGNRYRGRAAAMDYSGLIDGKAVGLAFLDHPRNPRHPTPWYLIRGPVMSYINAALLTDEPLILASGERMTLRYRLVIHPNRWNAERLQEARRQFQQVSAAPDTE